jgi:hypothetical protein
LRNIGAGKLSANIGDNKSDEITVVAKLHRAEASTYELKASAKSRALPGISAEFRAKMIIKCFLIASECEH